MKMTEEQSAYYRAYIHVAFVCAHVSDTYLGLAQDVLKQSGNYRFQEKMFINSAIKSIKKLSELSDGALKNGRKDFYSDVVFMDNLMDGILANVRSKEDENSLLEFINNLHKHENNI